MNDFRLKPSDKKRLQYLRRASREPARVLRRVQVLLLAGDGYSRSKIAELTGVSVATIGRLKRNYRQVRLECLYEKPRTGRPKSYTEFERSKVIALACSPPGKAHARWTIKLLAKESRLKNTTVYMILKEANIKPWKQKNVVSANPRR